MALRSVLLSGVAISGIALGAPQARADNECGTGKAVTCPAGTYDHIYYPNQSAFTVTLPSGVNVTPGTVYLAGTDLTLDAQSGSTISGVNATGVYVNSTGGSSTVVKTSQVTSSGGSTGTTGVFGVIVGGGATATTVVSGSASTTGGSSPALLVYTSSGAIDLTSGTAATSGSYVFQSSTSNPNGYASNAVYGSSTSGAITIHSGTATVSAQNAYANAIGARTGGAGSISITSATVNSASDYLSTISATTSGTGTVSIDSGTVTAKGNGATGIGASAGSDVTIKSQSITSTGGGFYNGSTTNYSMGIAASSNAGRVAITSGAISGSGDRFIGVQANGGSGAISIDSGTISLSGAGATGIQVSGAGDVTLSSKTITSTGAAASGANNIMITGQGINAYSSGGTVTINSGDISVAASGATAIGGSSAHNEVINLNGTVRSNGGAAVAFGVGGVGTVNVASGANVSSGASATIIVNDLNGTGSAVVNIAGTVTAPTVNGAAVYLGSGADTVNLTTGAHVTGYIVGGPGNDVLNMNGTINPSTPSQVFGNITQIETINVNSGYWTANGFVDTANVNIAAAATVESSGTSGTFIATGGSPSNTLAIVNNGTFNYTAASTIGRLNDTVHVSGTGISNQFGGLFLNSQAINQSQINVLGGTDIVTGDATAAFTVAPGAVLQIGANLQADSNTAGNYLVGTGGGTTGSVNGAILVDGSLIFDRSNDYSFGGSISGAGTITKNDGGLVTLAGADTFAGSLVLNGGQLAIASLQGGALQVTGPGSLVLGSGAQAASILVGSSNIQLQNAALTVAQSQDSTYSGGLSGTGSLRKSGAGSLLLSGSNSYSGGTTIDGGTLVVTGSLAGPTTVAVGGVLQVGAGGAAGALSGDLTINGTAIFARSDDYLFAGGVYGSGALIKQGSGVLTLDGAYGFTGTTDIQGGRLKITNLPATTMVAVDSGTIDLSGKPATVSGLSGSGGQVAIDGGALTVNQASASTYAGAVTGSGSLTLEGGGTLNLTGANTYTGPTTVEQGLLKVNGSITSPVTVASGGALGGSGVIASSVVVASGGVVTPGNSPGTLHVAGDFTFAGGSTYLAQVTPSGDHDLIAIGGRAIIQAGANVTVDPSGSAADYMRVNGYTIVTAAGGVSGTFTGLSSNLPLLSPMLSYTANAVNLTLVRNDIPLASLAGTPNGAAVAAAVERGGLASTPYSSLLLLDNATLATAFGRLSGEIYAATPTAILQGGGASKEAAMQRLEARQAGGAAVWAKVDGQEIVDPTRGYSKLTSDREGVVFGADTAFRGWTVGAVLAHSTQKARLSALANTSDIDSTYAGGYAGRGWGPYSLAVYGGWGWHDIDSRRTIAYPGVAQAAVASYSADGGSIFAEARYDWAVAGTTLQPFAGLGGVSLSTDGFTERGADAALRVGKDDRNVFFGTAGIRWAPVIALHNAVLTPSIAVAYEGASSDLSSRIDAAFASTGRGFQVSGAKLPGDAVKLSAGLDATLAHGVTLEGGLAAAYGARTTNAQAHVGVAWRF